VLNLTNGKLKQLGKGLEEATLMFAKFSPDGGRVAYVSKMNIEVEEIERGKIIKHQPFREQKGASDPPEDQPKFPRPRQEAVAERGAASHRASAARDWC